MWDEELDGASVTLVVAQRPFEKASESGVWNAFATLVPILHQDGRAASPEEFPANGDVWWMLRPGTRGLAEPGRLLTGTLEVTELAGTPGKASYQVRVDSVEAADAAQLVEILDLPPDWASEPREIIAQGRPFLLDHPPLDRVYVRWRGYLYGPLRTACEAAAEEGQWGVCFSTADRENHVQRIPESALKKVSAGRHYRPEVEVSLRDRPPYQVPRPHTCRYHLLPAEDFQTATAPEVARLVLESDQAVIARIAKKLLSRSKRQELTRLLDELNTTIHQVAGTTTLDGAEVVQALQRQLEKEERDSEQLAEALLAAGVLDQQLQRTLQRAEQAHVEKHAARLQTEIDKKIAEARQELGELVKKKEATDEECKALQRERSAALDRELEQKGREFERTWREREDQLERQQRELVRQRELLSGNLTRVAQELAENRDGLVNQFLAISPLLQQLNLFPGPSEPPSPPAVTPAAEPRAGKPFTLPAFVLGGSTPPPVSELLFFERFVKHVEASGFKHRRLDLAGFHLSVKCNDLTVLGGLPGTGKSSLPRLYAEALAGDEYEDGVQRYLHVGVSPSWLDMRDVLGHTNALDHCFQPAECGLYPFLICAQEEETRRSLDSRLYLVCLDEMNLAQVEHYFSGFIQALERPAGRREVRCFSPEIVARADPFSPWPVLNLPRTLRFLGTVNFDETTRQLSQRVLDRANLLRLRPSYLLDAREAGLVRPSGPAITLRTYREWVAPVAALDRSLAELIDQLKDHLARLGCPLNPRRFNALRTFLASAPGDICRPEQALDLQIAQRILPQVRSVFGRGAQEALEGVKKTLAGHPSGFPESLQLLEELRASDYSADLYGEGVDA